MRSIERDGLAWLLYLQRGGIAVREMTIPTTVRRSYYDQLIAEGCPAKELALFETQEWARKSWPVSARADILGIGSGGEIRIIEIKTSRSDFLAELASEKWKKSIGIADLFYYLLGPGVGYWDQPHLPKHAGVLIHDPKGYGHYSIKVARRPSRLYRGLGPEAVADLRNRIAVKCYWLWYEKIREEENGKRSAIGFR